MRPEREVGSGVKNDLFEHTCDAQVVVKGCRAELIASFAPVLSRVGEARVAQVQVLVEDKRIGLVRPLLHSAGPLSSCAHYN